MMASLLSFLLQENKNFYSPKKFEKKNFPIESKIQKKKQNPIANKVGSQKNHMF